MLKSLKSFWFLAEHGRIIRLNWINPFCHDINFTTAAHFRGQCETLKINFSGLFKIFLNFQSRSVASSENG